MSDQPPFLLRLAQMDHDGKYATVWQSAVYMTPGSRLQRLDTQMFFYDPNGYRHSLPARLVPWQTVEDIAAYVRGDGTDAQRQALADGILEGRREPQQEPREWRREYLGQWVPLDDD